MKRFLTILGVALFLASNGAFAEQQTLIDFSTLIGSGDQGLHAQTTIDYSRQAGSSYSAEDKAKMKISLAIPSWEVQLSSSSQTVDNQSNSMVLAAPVNKDASKYAGDTVMGVRIHFPSYAINSYAIIKPPFTIPAYQTLENSTDQNAKPGSQFDGFGVLKNVGVLKSIQINVLGRNYSNSLSLLLENDLGEEQEIFMGFLNFDGWKALTWVNPNYQTQVRNRDIKVLALYPRSEPFIKLKGIIIHRDGSQDGGDMVAYFKDIKVIFDQAVLPGSAEVNDEAVWGILKQREESQRNFELAKLGNLQVLRALEVNKMAKETGFDQTAAAAAPAAAAPAATKP
jgi:Flagellar filament outer layer protein Flaa